MMALNRYQLKHLTESGQHSAKLVSWMLERQDRLLGTILFGNNLANMAAATVSTLIALKLYGQFAVSFATGIVTLVILVFAEIPPKTVAATYPARIAYPAAYILYPLMRLCHPLIWLVNAAGNFVLSLLGIKVGRRSDTLNAQELRAAVQEAGEKIPVSHQDMLLRILALEGISVDDVMVPRSAIEAIDLDDDWDEILDQLRTSHHTRIPLYRGSIDQVIGEIHLRKVVSRIQDEDFDKAALEEIASPSWFIPEGSNLTQQLLDLQSRRRQMALVVDEYGDIKGLITLDEILEEIVGEFTSYVPGIEEDVHADGGDGFLVSGSANVRDLNRKMSWQLPEDGPKTLNGLILEQLEDIPVAGVKLSIAGYSTEIVQIKDNSVSVARIKGSGNFAAHQENSTY